MGRFLDKFLRFRHSLYDILLYDMMRGDGISLALWGLLFRDAGFRIRPSKLTFSSMF